MSYAPSKKWCVLGSALLVFTGGLDGPNPPKVRRQSVQNATARLISSACLHDHITLILATLHRLPVRQRVIFKTSVLVWNTTSVCRRRLRTAVASLAPLSVCPMRLAKMVCFRVGTHYSCSRAVLTTRVHRRHFKHLYSRTMQTAREYG